LQSTSFLSGAAFLKNEISYYGQIEEESFSGTSDYRVDIAAAQNYFYMNHRERSQGNKLRIRTLEGKTSLDMQLTPFHELRAGFNYQRIRFHQETFDSLIVDEQFNTDRYPDTSIVRTVFRGLDVPNETIAANSFKTAAYIEEIWQASDRLIFNIGGRVDYFDFNKDLNISPRLSGSFRGPFGTTLRAAWGHYYQSPIYRQFAYTTASDSNTQAQRATHYILGAEHTLALNANSNSTLKLKLEGFYKKYDELISSTRTSDGRINYSRRNDATGSASGMEVYAALNLPRFFGWVSYGLLYAKEDLRDDGKGAYPRYTDQRHTLALVADVDLGKRWSANARIFYGSGYAYTPFTARFNNNLQRWEWIAGEQNSAHLPAYKRVDARVSRELKIWNLSALAFIDVSNLFNFDNVFGYNYSFTNTGLPKVEPEELFPIVPTLGVTLRF